jgi:hypothetical protein
MFQHRRDLRIIVQCRRISPILVFNPKIEKVSVSRKFSRVTLRALFRGQRASSSEKGGY